MTRIFAASVALVALGACGDGNPFTTDSGTGDGGVVDFVIPEEIASGLTSFAFDPANNTLSVTGLQRDGDEVTVDYVRNAALDQGQYLAFTFQDDPLDEHTTVYVREIGSVRATTAVTGGQFGFFTGGVGFERTGGFDPITPNAAADQGLVSYSGDYAGLSDTGTPPTSDLLPVPAGVDPSFQPSQANPVTGRVFINVEFATNEMSGRISQRQTFLRTPNAPAGELVTVPDLLLTPTQLDANGYFSSDSLQIDPPGGTRQDVGSYAGVIGGTDSDAIAGGLYASDHYTGTVDGAGTELVFEDEEEYGIFVLGRCGTSQPDHGSECPIVDPE